MKERILKFGEGLLKPTLSQEKRMTLRRYRPEAHDFKEGQYFVGRFADGLDIVLKATVDTEITTFGKLTDDIARQDGFTDAQDAFLGMKKYYEDLTPDTPCAIIRYEIPLIAEMPSVRISLPEN
ncbi:MAG TPA: hypothetical protein PK045_01345 [Candidatus Woesebacteria bacterium]|nr:hypothetical protein [Patescibacteria group bacterium]HOY61133.1 hypothetical protein [Candidatus Woesebacteria bacterium]